MAHRTTTADGGAIASTAHRARPAVARERRQPTNAGAARWRQSIRFGIAATVLYRVVVGAVVLHHRDGMRFPLTMLQHPQDALLTLANLHWDAAIVTDLADNGYSLGVYPAAPPAPRAPHPEWATFPPVLPACIHAVAAVLHVSSATAGLLIVTLVLTAAVSCLHRLATLDHGAHVGSLAGILLLVFPAAAFLGVAYEDVVALAALLGAFLFLRSRRPELAAVLFSIAVLSKVVVIVALPALLLEWLEVERRPLRRPGRRWVWLVGAPVAALALWGLYIDGAYHAGPTFFLSEQRFYGHNLTLPFVGVRPMVRLLVDNRFIHGGLVYWVDLAGPLLLAGAAAVLWRVRRSYAVLCAAFALAFISNGSLMATGRHVMLAFPVFIAGALLLADRRLLRWVVIAASALLALSDLVRYTNALPID